MKKSILAMFFALFALFVATPVVYADDMPEISATDDEPLPPMIDPASADDASGN